MKWITTLLCLCWVCAQQTHQTMFLQFIKDDTHVVEVNQHIQVKPNGQMLIEGKKHLTLFMEIVNHNNNKCFEMTEKETLSYIHCYDISHVSNMIFNFAEGETVLSQDLLFTYNEELSLYIMNICFINDNKSLFNKEETQFTFDNDISEISFWQLKMYFGWGIVVLVFLIYGVPIIGVIIIVIIIVSCIVNRIRASDPYFNNTNKHQHMSSKNITRTKVSIKFTELFPYEPENIFTPQVIHQSMLSLNDNIDYVLFPKVPIYNTNNNNS